MLLQIYTLRAKVKIVFPGKDFNLWIDAVAFLGSNLHGSGPMFGPFSLVTSPNSAERLVMKSFRQKNITLDLREVGNDITDMFSQTLFAI